MTDAKDVFNTSSLRFDTAGLIPRKDEPQRKLWLNGFNDVVELRAFALPPDIPVRLRDAAGLRAYYDAAARTQGAQVLGLEVVQTPVRAFDAAFERSMQVIGLLMRAPAKPRGFVFVGSVALPFKRGSFVLRHQATEVIEREDLSAQSDAAHPAHALTRIRAGLGAVRFSASAALLDEQRLDERPWYAFWQR